MSGRGSILEEVRRQLVGEGTVLLVYLDLKRRNMEGILFLAVSGRGSVLDAARRQLVSTASLNWNQRCRGVFRASPHPSGLPVGCRQESGKSREKLRLFQTLISCGLLSFVFLNSLETFTSQMITPLKQTFFTDLAMSTIRSHLYLPYFSPILPSLLAEDTCHPLGGGG